jgi:hypothetical protein
MPALLEYRLNIDGNVPIHYVFDGSGSLNISGTAKYTFESVTGDILLDYDLRDYVYDTSHNIGQIVLITGTPERLVYTVEFNGELYEYTKEQLRGFGTGATYFNSKWTNMINNYIEIIDGINERLGIINESQNV